MPRHRSPASLLEDVEACALARLWFNVGDSDTNMWAYFAATGAIESVPRMRDALREGAIQDPSDAGTLLRYIEAHGERGPQRDWGWA